MHRVKWTLVVAMTLVCLLVGASQDNAQINVSVPVHTSTGTFYINVPIGSSPPPTTYTYVQPYYYPYLTYDDEVYYYTSDGYYPYEDDYDYSYSWSSDDGTIYYYTTPTETIRTYYYYWP